MLPIWLLAAMMIMMYYWRFWEPWANAMLAILLPKLCFGLKIMTGTTVFACLPGAHPYWPKKASKRTVLHNRLNKEKTPGRCCQSGSLLLTAPCCSLLLLAAAYLLLTCCCSPAAHPDSLHWDHHRGEIHRGNKN